MSADVTRSTGSRSSAAGPASGDDQPSAAGVAAAFNTPLAGLLFAIEELASAYEQRVTLLVLAAIVIAGMVAQSVVVVLNPED